MMLSLRDLDILQLLRWCRMIRSKELCETFSKDEVVNLCAAQTIRFSDAAKAWYRKAPNAVLPHSKVGGWCT